MAKVITDFKRINRLNKIMSVLVKMHTALTYETVKLGYPLFTDDAAHCPTAQVAVSEDGRIRYVWNRTFFDKCSNLALQYISQHEALHIVLRHCERRGERLPKWWNIAADGIINWILDQWYADRWVRAKLPEEYRKSLDHDPVLKDRITDGKLKVYSHYDVDCANAPTETVYDAIMGKFKDLDLGKLKSRWDDSGDGDQQGEGEGKEGEGKPSKDDYGKLGKLLDNHDDWDNKINPETQAAIEEIREQAEYDAEDYPKSSGRHPGNMPGLTQIELKSSTRNCDVPWQTLLRNRLATVHKPLDADSWARPHRKLYLQYPETILPGEHEDEVNRSLIMFLVDTSASINNNQLSEGIAIVESLPADQYELVIAWFDTEVYECIDLHKPAGRGGTSFKAIEEVLRGEKELWGKDYREGNYSNDWKPSGSSKRVEKYPDVVIVWTDGEAHAPDPLHPTRWIFMLDPLGTTNYIKNFVRVFGLQI